MADTNRLIELARIIDRPWKAIALVVVVAVGVVGAVAYQERTLILTHWFAPSVPAPSVAVFNDTAPGLLAGTGADVARLFAVDANISTMRLLAAFDQTGPQSEGVGVPRAIFPIGIDADFLARFTRREAVCLGAAGLPKARIFAIEGFGAACAIAVSARGTITGSLAIAWRQAAGAEHFDTAKSLMVPLATRIGEGHNP
jgi:hypothetical protein